MPFPPRPFPRRLAAWATCLALLATICGQPRAVSAGDAGAARSGAFAAAAVLPRAEALPAYEDFQGAGFPDAAAASPEETSRGLEEITRRVDMALLEALRRQGLPPDRLRLEEVTLAPHAVMAAGGACQSQRLALENVPRLEHLLAEMQVTLAQFVPQARLDDAGAAGWRVLARGLVTHHIALPPREASSSDRPPLTTSHPPSHSPLHPTEAQPSGRRVSPGAGRLVLVIDDLGASLEQARELLALDAPIVFAILPFAQHRREVAEMAHAGGREVLVHLPMEPVRHPAVDAGPDALLVQQDPETVARLALRNLDAIPHAIGFNNHMGSRFTQRRDLLAPVLEAARAKGFFALDSLTHERSVLAEAALAQGLTAYRRDVFLDVERDVTAILRQLRLAERLAATRGQAVAIGHPHPETLEALRRFVHGRTFPGVALSALRQIAPLDGTALAGR